MKEKNLPERYGKNSYVMITGTSMVKDIILRKKWPNVDSI